MLFRILRSESDNVNLTDFFDYIFSFIVISLLSQAYDRHVQWCMEKSRRLQVSPKKDLAAIAKLQARTSYRPRTPARKESTGSGGSPSRKTSNTSVESCGTPDPFGRSLSRSESRTSRRGSFRATDISFLGNADHTKTTSNTKFIRNTTGRGSIKRGPAPTKSSVLRHQV